MLNVSPLLDADGVPAGRIIEEVYATARRRFKKCVSWTPDRIDDMIGCYYALLVCSN